MALKILVVLVLKHLSKDVGRLCRIPTPPLVPPNLILETRAIAKIATTPENHKPNRRRTPPFSVDCESPSKIYRFRAISHPNSAIELQRPSPVKLIFTT
ncbi:hypothetical protein TIFTF001_017585 [Ficus carica]|uniref:Uncharacterized protein n=1 Tax=Ficus carica TaxID=3494 RepID=A0AA88AAX1_FICCA|nr:hypothetical protein TIFTF001_017585 [Ficus carica]